MEYHRRVTLSIPSGYFYSIYIKAFIIMGFSSKESIEGLIAALQHVRSVYFPPKKEKKLERELDLSSLDNASSIVCITQAFFSLYLINHYYYFRSAKS